MDSESIYLESIQISSSQTQRPEEDQACCAKAACVAREVVLHKTLVQKHKESLIMISYYYKSFNSNLMESEQSNSLLDQIDAVEGKIEEVKLPEETKPAKPIIQPYYTSLEGQSPGLKEYLQKVVLGDPYNKYCVDCHHNHSTHACITFGTFVCGDCANLHKIYFEGRTRSGIKSIYNEQWDDNQLEVINSQFGGNERFFHFMMDFKIHELIIRDKYKHKAVLFYARRLNALLDRANFIEEPPAKDWNETFNRVIRQSK